MESQHTSLVKVAQKGGKMGKQAKKRSTKLEKLLKKKIREVAKKVNKIRMVAKKGQQTCPTSYKSFNKTFGIILH